MAEEAYEMKTIKQTDNFSYNPIDASGKEISYTTFKINSEDRDPRFEEVEKSNNEIGNTYHEVIFDDMPIQ